MSVAGADDEADYFSGAWVQAHFLIIFRPPFCYVAAMSLCLGCALPVANHFGQILGVYLQHLGSAVILWKYPPLPMMLIPFLMQ